MKIKFFLILWFLNYSISSAQVKLPISSQLDNAVKILALDDSALVYYDGKGLGLMNLLGERLSPANYFSIIPLGANRYSVQNQENGRSALMSYTGKLLSPFDYKEISVFSGTIARVSRLTKDSSRSEYALMNSDALVLSDWMDTMALPADNGICLMKDQGIWLLFQNGKYEPLPLKYEDVGKYNEGLAPAKVDGLWGYINEKGHWEISPEYKKANEFQGRYAAVSTNDHQWHFIDRKGEIMLSEVFDTIIQYQEGSYSIVSEGQKWRFLSPLLQPIHSNSYDKISPFSKEGLAKVKKDSFEYYIDLFGEVVFKADELLDFKDGIGVFRKGNLWGWIDENGDDVVAPKYKKVLANVGRNLIVSLDSVLYLVKNNGEVVQEIISEKNDIILTKSAFIYGVQPTYFIVDVAKSNHQRLLYDEVGDISNGFIAVKKDGLYGYVNIDGKEIFPPTNSSVAVPTHQNLVIQKTLLDNFISYDFSKNIQFSLAPGVKFLGPYSESRAKVLDAMGRMGFIDDKGQVVVECKYSMLGDYKNGRAIFQKINGMFGYLDDKGEEVIPAIYQFVSDFDVSGFAVVVKDQLFGFINRLGNVVIPFQYEKVYSFKNGIASVQKNGKVGYINMNNKAIVPFSFDEAYESVNDLALVRMGTYWGYVSPKGKVIIPWQYEAAQAFSEGKAWVKLSGKYGLIDERGKYLTAFKYENAFPFQQGFAQVQLQDKWGLVNSYGVEIIPPVCEQIGNIYNNKVVVKTLSQGYGITILK
ncbi:MAG TPA: WG repeat-containing protein [Chitinophagales bacterium]|nr:WG repeat-containing protein [Chitinophagales bacterium]